MEKIKKIEIEIKELKNVIDIIESHYEIYKSKEQEYKNNKKITVYIQGYFNALFDLKNYIILEIETLKKDLKNLKNKSMI